MTSSSPRISIVVAAYNSRSTVSKCLKSLSQLDHPSYEVIIVDDGSTDGTAELCESFQDVNVLRLPRGGPSKARNFGIRAARGPIVAFTDADCVVERCWLKELEKGFTGPEVAGVGGDQVSPIDECETGKRIQDFLRTIGFVSSYMKTDAVFREIDHNASCNSAYRREILEQVEGFDETQFPGEDLELDLKIRRLGYKLIYNPAAVVGHYRPGTYRGFARMMKRYGAGEWHLVKKHGLFRPLDFEPFVFAFGLVFFPLAIILYPWAWTLLVLPWPLLYSWFLLRTWDVAKAFQFVLFLLLTLTSWNWGFITGSRHRVGT